MRNLESRLNKKKLTFELIAHAKEQANRLFDEETSQHSDSQRWRSVYPDIISLFPILSKYLKEKDLIQHGLMAFYLMKEKLEKKNNPAPETTTIPSYLNEVPHPADKLSNKTPKISTKVRNQISDLIKQGIKSTKTPEEVRKLVTESERLLRHLGHPVN